MARLGRGQPRAPFFLRNIAALVATLAPQVHVYDQPRIPARPITSHVYYVRPARNAVVPDRLAPQIHLTAQATALARRVAIHGDVLLLRAPDIPTAVSAKPSAPRIVGVAEISPPIRLRRGAVVSLRPSRTSLVPDRLAPQVRIVSQAVARAPRVAIRGKVLTSRAPDIPIVSAKAPAFVIRTVTASSPPQSLHRGVVVYVRPSRASQVPLRLAPQITVLRQRIRPPAVRVIELRNPAAFIVPPPLPEQLHLISQAVVRPYQPVHRRAAVLYIRPSRSSLVPARLAPQIHVLIQRIRPRATHILLERAPLIQLSVPLYLVVDEESLPRLMVLASSTPAIATDPQSLPRLGTLDLSDPQLDVESQSGPYSVRDAIVSFDTTEVPFDRDIPGLTWDRDEA